MVCDTGSLENDQTSWSDALLGDPMYASIWDIHGSDGGFDQTEMTAL